jgi:hypothetical protein
MSFKNNILTGKKRRMEEEEEEFLSKSNERTFLIEKQ